MCSNFQPIKNYHADWVKKHFDCDLPSDDWRPETYPTYSAPFIYLQDGKPKCELAQFGLVPAWAQDKKKYGLRTYNARSETVHEKPSYRTAWRERRFGIVPVERFYEPNWETGNLVAKQYKERPGNYIFFLSSFDYLNNVKSLFVDKYPDIPTRSQSRTMTEGDKERFVNEFTIESQGVVFAVLGGSFGEAIDLPGDRLIGAFIATLGLPQINEVNEQMRMRMQEIFGLGYEYTYLYPGLQKVVQAAGRVIRTTNDTGVIYLMDDRYDEPKIQKLLPKWWSI